MLRKAQILGAGKREELHQPTWALITVSGTTNVSSSNDVWVGIANVMLEVQANVQDAAGSFMQVLPDEKPTKSGPSFFVSAFHTHISSFTGADVRISREKCFAVAIFFKVSVAADKMPIMRHLLSTRFPSLVCTLTAGGIDEDSKSALEGSDVPWAVSGSVRLFGPDGPGQLAQVAEILHRCNWTIVNLQVITGFCDVETCEFLERAGGPLSENVITVAALDASTADEQLLRLAVANEVKKVGYHVTSIILDTQAMRAQELAGQKPRRVRPI